MQTSFEKIKNNNLVQAICAFCLIFLFFLPILSKTSSYGIQLMEDHVIARYSKTCFTEPNTTPLTKVISDTVSKSVNKQHRFRPGFDIARVVAVKLFGTDFAHLAVLSWFLGVSSAYFLYLIGVILGLNFWESLLFSSLALIGTQFEIWWRLLWMEPIAMFFLCPAVFILLYETEAEKNINLLKTIYILLLLITSLIKESFILLIPAIVFAKIWFYKHKKNSTWLEAAKENAVISSILLFIFCLEIYLILFQLNLRGLDYSGIGKETYNVFKIYKVLGTFAQEQAPLGGFIIPFLLVFGYWLYGLKEDFKFFFKIDVLYFFIFFIMWVLPQALLYAKGGVYQRYFLPGIIAFSLLNVFFLAKIRLNNKLSNRKIIYFVTFAFFLYYPITQYRASNKQLNAFYSYGTKTKALFDDVNERTGSEDLIVIVGDLALNTEDISAIDKFSIYMLNKKRENIFFDFVFTKGSYNKLHKTVFKKLVDGYKERDISKVNDKSKISTIIMYSRAEPAFLVKSKDWFDIKDYNKVYYGTRWFGYYKKPSLSQS